MVFFLALDDLGKDVSLALSQDGAGLLIERVVAVLAIAAFLNQLIHFRLFAFLGSLNCVLLAQFHFAKVGFDSLAKRIELALNLGLLAFFSLFISFNYLRSGLFRALSRFLASLFVFGLLFLAALLLFSFSLRLEASFFLFFRLAFGFFLSELRLLRLVLLLLIFAHLALHFGGSFFSSTTTVYFSRFFRRPCSFLRIVAISLLKNSSRFLMYLSMS